MVTMIVIALISLFVALFFVAPSGDAKDDTRLMHAQGGWVQLAIAAVGAYAQNRAERRAVKDEARYNRFELMTEGDEDRRTAAFQAALQDYYQQQGNQRARNSLANFSRFSSAPQGGEPYYSPELPEMPDYRQYANPENTSAQRRP